MQGVGFRPFIFSLAKEHSLNGTVANTLEGVHLFLDAEQGQLAEFLKQIRERSPKQSLITSITNEEIPFCDFTEFNIIESDPDGYPDLLITPDFAICESCVNELKDPGNRRHNYPYITCTSCGPRYSIETALPYDRHRTSMGSFTMCHACIEEYWDPKDARFYSQTNSCPGCKISQWIVDAKGNQMDIREEETVDFICRKVMEGSVVAVKGIGGYLLICDAENEQRVNELRQDKQRPAKPFALLYPDLAQVQTDFTCTKNELQALTGPAAPIVLLNVKENSDAASLQAYIAPGLDRLGVMLPYAPLLVLIAEKVNKPLLATSGNQKGSPITYKNKEAIELLNSFADYFLFNNREIQIPQDDSVVKYSAKFHQKIIIRRSRGYAPGFIQQAVKLSFQEDVLAMGALLKSTFCIWQQGRCHISQFLGDTTEFDAQLSYERTLKHIQGLLKFKPEVILVDKHPAYFSTLLGKELSVSGEISLVDILHHEAHFWAVLGENNLLETREKVLGVVLDGTGMGNDGAIWGGEFFDFYNGQITKIHHLTYYPHILGDKMAREPRLSAYSVLHTLGNDYELIKHLFSGEELEYYSKVLDHSTLKTSSMGRVFDAVSSLLGLCHINTYEGEAAMYLESEAQKHCQRSGDYPPPYPYLAGPGASIDLRDTFCEIIRDITAGKPTDEIAAKFHGTIVQIIHDIAMKSGYKSVAFSGGVFQNGLLVDMIIDRMSDEFTLYFHEDLSPNDECISYGQLVGYYMMKTIKTDKEEIVHSKNMVS